MTRRTLQWLYVAASFLVGTSAATAQGAPANAPPTRFMVKVENISSAGTLRLSGGGSAAIPLSSGVWVIHTAQNPMFTPGQVEPGRGLKGLAEAGMAAEYAPNLQGLAGVRNFGVFDKPVSALVRRMSSSRMKMMKDEAAKVNAQLAEGNPVIASRMLQPSQRFEFTVDAQPGDRLSLAMMVAQSNDGLLATAADGIPLFGPDGRPVRGDFTEQLAIWDVGTEANEQPGLGRNQGLRQGAPYAGDPERRPVRLMTDAEFGSMWPAVSQIVRISITTAAR